MGKMKLNWVIVNGPCNCSSRKEGSSAPFRLEMEMKRGKKKIQAVSWISPDRGIHIRHISTEGLIVGLVLCHPGQEPQRNEKTGLKPRRALQVGLRKM